MREKLLFLGMLILSVLYWVEVVGAGSYEWYQYIGLAITVLTILPWLISILISQRKKSKERAEEAALKAARRDAKEAKKNK